MTIPGQPLILGVVADARQLGAAENTTQERQRAAVKVCDPVSGLDHDQRRELLAACGLDTPDIKTWIRERIKAREKKAKRRGRDRDRAARQTTTAAGRDDEQERATP